MFFSDQFEYTASDNKIYYIEVEGDYLEDEDGEGPSILLTYKQFTDEEGNIIDKDDDIYSELLEEATYRDYEIENHHTDHSYYNLYLDELI